MAIEIKVEYRVVCPDGTMPTRPLDYHKAHDLRAACDERTGLHRDCEGPHRIEEREVIYEAWR